MSCTAACLPAAATARRPRASSSNGAAAAPRLRVVAGAGFGTPSQKSSGTAKQKQKQPKVVRYLEKEAAPSSGAAAGADDGWVEMPGVEADKTFLSKPIKPLILATGRAVCLYKVGGSPSCVG